MCTRGQRTCESCAFATEDPRVQEGLEPAVSQNPHRRAVGCVVVPLADSGIAVVPGPPKISRAIDVVDAIKQMAKQTSDAGLGVRIKTICPREKARRHWCIVHDAGIHLDDVEREARRDHDTGLGLPEVVTDGQEHEENVVCRPANPCRAPGLLAARHPCVVQRSQCGGTVSPLREHKGRHLPPKLLRRFPHFPRHPLPLVAQKICPCHLIDALEFHAERQTTERHRYPEDCDHENGTAAEPRKWHMQWSRRLL
mmetsp:Transcript_40128/g.85621  ORF Transcript_40128/g.85621 Transcript_40128/m.85621 type:complete len:254 (-) Transcript_40128:9-770(-)